MNERLKIGFVGVGYGAVQIEPIQRGAGSPFFEMAGVYDLNAERAAECADHFGVRVYASLEEMLADKDIQTIGLFTPPAGRAELLRRIIRAGKDVMTTKPFELDSGVALAVLQEAERVGRVIHLNSPSALPSADMTQIMSWIDEFDLGRPIACRVDSWGGWGASEIADGSWYDDPRRCPVAPIFRIGIYGINDLVRLWGEADEIQVMQARLVYGRPTADTAQINVRFKNGALANIFSSVVIQDGQWREGSLLLNYERGSIYRNMGHQTNPDSTHLALAATRNGEVSTREVVVPGRTGDYQWEIFYRVVRGEKPAGLVTPEQIVASIKIIEAMAQIQPTGQ